MIYIIGFMGVGKSTIARELSKQLNISFVDTDEKIEKQEKNSIINIFNTNGEIYFRKLEAKLLKQIKEKQVIACGGGMPLFNNNMEYICKTGVSIYLEASPEFLFSRLKNERKERPLISQFNNYELKQFIYNQYTERKKIYNKATYKINVDNKTMEEILGEIHSLL
jgi:shikimate kinase